jgi:hypothetical protein
LNCVEMASFYYSAFGLSLHAEQPLPGLVALPAASDPDVRICLGTLPPDWERVRQDSAKDLPWYTSPTQDTPGQPALIVWRLAGGLFFHLRYSDATEFTVDRAGRHIWATWSPASTLADTAMYLLGPILGLVLRLRGLVCLHASAVAVGERAFALLGVAGAGKSTLAAAFARRGEAVLADDVTALQPDGDAFLIRPAYPQLRLWPESVRMLYGDERALPALTPTWEKCGLDLTQSGYRFAARPLRLSAIYVLGERRTVDAPGVQELPEAGRLALLAQNTYVNYLLDREMRAAEFAVLARLVATTPLRRATAHCDAARLPELCDAIVNDFLKS